MKVIFSEHALFEIEFRKIKKEDIEHLIEHPMQKKLGMKNRIIMQSRYYDNKENKEMVLRVIGEELENEFHVVTVYKTSKIEKYWKEDLK
jgi:hypothetical protein